jgi:DNA polymerase III epsilon subunit-like protein
MSADIVNLNRHYEKLHNYVYLHIQQGVKEWARLISDHPRALLLVVETTQIIDSNGYATGSSEPIRISGLSLADGEIWDQLLSPTYSLEVRGAEYHGLSLDDLKSKPRLAGAWSSLVVKLLNRHVVIFGAAWARDALRSVTQSQVLDEAFCLHSKTKEFYNEFYDLSLEKILSYQGIDKKREELTDSRDRLQVLAQVVRNLAVGMAKQTPESETSDDAVVADGGDELGDLDDHPF